MKPKPKRKPKSVQPIVGGLDALASRLYESGCEADGKLCVDAGDLISRLVRRIDSLEHQIKESHARK